MQLAAKARAEYFKKLGYPVKRSVLTPFFNQETNAIVPPRCSSEIEFKPAFEANRESSFAYFNLNSN